MRKNPFIKFPVVDCDPKDMHHAWEYFKYLTDSDNDLIAIRLLVYLALGRYEDWADDALYALKSADNSEDAQSALEALTHYRLCIEKLQFLHDHIDTDQ